MSNEVEVRRLSAGEVGRAARLFALYREFYGQPFDLRVAEQFLRERVERAQSIVLLAELDGQAVGFTQLYPGFSSVSAAPAWVLNDLYVLADARGRGVADALMERAEAVAREGGAVVLSLQTARYSTDATFVSYAKRLS